MTDEEVLTELINYGWPGHGDRRPAPCHSGWTVESVRQYAVKRLEKRRAEQHRRQTLISEGKLVPPTVARQCAKSYGHDVSAGDLIRWRSQGKINGLMHDGVWHYWMDGLHEFFQAVAAGESRIVRYKQEKQQK